MSKLSFIITKKAVADIEEIWKYTADNWSVTDRYYTLILDEIDHICENPSVGKSMEHVRKGYRAQK